MTSLSSEHWTRNLDRVYEYVCEHPWSTRAQIAEGTGVSPTGVYSAIRNNRSCFKERKKPLKVGACVVYYAKGKPPHVYRRIVDAHLLRETVYSHVPILQQHTTNDIADSVSADYGSVWKHTIIRHLNALHSLALIERESVGRTPYTGYLWSRPRTQL
jgi:hypothetical protein